MVTLTILIVVIAKALRSVQIPAEYLKRSN